MKTISMVLKNHLSEIESLPTKVTDQELDNILNLSKGFHFEENAFEMWTKDGFVVVPPEIAKHSILTIKIQETNENVSNI